jgi:hypothetical protein
VTAQLDESVPVRLAKALAVVGCRVLRFPNDWKGLKNGELLARVRSAGCSCLVTCDKNIRYQQTTSLSGLALVVLPRQRFEDVAPLASAIAMAVEQAQPGEVIAISTEGKLSRMK